MGRVMPSGALYWIALVAALCIDLSCRSVNPEPQISSWLSNDACETGRPSLLNGKDSVLLFFESGFLANDTIEVHLCGRILYSGVNQKMEFGTDGYRSSWYVVVHRTGLVQVRNVDDDSIVTEMRIDEDRARAYDVVTLRVGGVCYGVRVDNARPVMCFRRNDDGVSVCSRGFFPKYL